MGRKKYPFFSLSFRLVAVISCILLLLSCASVWIDPGAFPPAGFFGLYFIPILILNVLLLVIALLRWSSSAWIPAAALLPALFFVGFFFRAGDRNRLPDSVLEKSNGIKIMTWNVGGFRSGADEDISCSIRGVTELVAQESPDIVSFQEFRTGNPEALGQMFPAYPYIREHFFRLHNGDYVGNVTLSRLPLCGDGYLPFRATTNMVLYTDVEFMDKVLRLYNVHLESNNISLHSFISNVRDGGYDELSQELAEAHEKVKKSSSRRGTQVRALLEDMESSGLLPVICGDVNDTPMSYCVRRLYRGHKDTFCEAGKGFGATYRLMWPLLRIDYVFVPENVQVLEHRTPRVLYSDHYPVIVKIQI